MPGGGKHQVAEALAAANPIHWAFLWFKHPVKFREELDYRMISRILASLEEPQDEIIHISFNRMDPSINHQSTINKLGVTARLATPSAKTRRYLLLFQAFTTVTTEKNLGSRKAGESLCVIFFWHKNEVIIVCHHFVIIVCYYFGVWPYDKESAETT